MIRIVLLLVIMLVYSGCPIYSTRFVNVDGDVRWCESSQDLVSFFRGATPDTSCFDRMRAGGYLKDHEIGAIGIRMAASRPDTATIERVAPGSPAEGAGLQPGDQIVGIDGVRETSLRRLGVLMFRPAGTRVSLDVLRSGREFRVEMTRVPYRSIE